MKGDFGGIDAIFRTPPRGVDSRFFVALVGQQLLGIEGSQWTYTPCLR